MRLGALLVPNVQWDVLVERTRRLEELGIGNVWIDDHGANPLRTDLPWFDSMTTLAGLACATSRIRLGPLVANAVLRHPRVLARQLLTLDHVSDGRIDVGFGSGYSPSDHDIGGSTRWPPEERHQRFAEAAELLDGALRGEPVTVVGDHYGVDGLVLRPDPIQAPRPPLTIAAHGPRALAVAARHADTWSSFGGWDLSAEQLLDDTRRRGEHLDACCAELGRDPSTIRRSLLVGNPAVLREPIWASASAFEDFAGRARDAGIDDLVVYYPPQMMYRRGEVPPDVFEQVVADVLPRLAAR